jgi:transposase
VFTGPERRRDWPDERKIAIVAESLVPGVNVSALARSHEINPQQLFGWRRRFRRQSEALVALSRREPEPIAFAAVQVDGPAAVLPHSSPLVPGCEPSIEIAFGKATVRIRGAVDAKTLALVLKALKVLA